MRDSVISSSKKKCASMSPRCLQIDFHFKSKRFFALGYRQPFFAPIKFIRRLRKMCVLARTEIKKIACRLCFLREKRRILRDWACCWADMVFALNGTVTLTFDLVTSKLIQVIYWAWPIFLPSAMTVTHKLFKILSGHGFCIKWYCDLDLWPSDLKIYRGHLLTMTNLPTKYHDCDS